MQSQKIAKTYHTDAVRAGGLVLSIQSSLTEFYNEEDFWKPLALREFSALTEYLDGKGNARTWAKLPPIGSDTAAISCCSKSKEKFFIPSA